jgi:hypothetical protein
MRALYLALLFSSLVGRGASWQDTARRLTGESEEVTRHAIEDLRDREKIEDELRVALATKDQALALETIAALRWDALLPDLISATWQDEKGDPQGAIFLAINALISPENQERIARLYLDRLKPDRRYRLSIPAQTVILDTVARMGIRLPYSDIWALLHDRAYDLRLAALAYARQMYRQGKFDYLGVIEEAQGLPPYQLAEMARATLPAAERALASREPASEPRFGYCPSVETAPETFAGSPRCASTYSQFYGESAVEIRVVFGYKDARPARYVGDRYEALALKQRLLANCSLGNTGCGFKPDGADAELLWREVADPQGNPHELWVRIVHSSVGPDDEENRRDPLQARQSAHAKASFLDGLSTARAVFYDGHSRDGGGPDFAPPRLTGDEHVDYHWYSENRPGLNELRPRLGEKDLTKLVGFFSCISDRFVPELLEEREDLALISSPRLMFYADAIDSLHAAISSLAGKRCERDFQSSLKVGRTGSHVHLRSFFQPD